MKCVYFCKQEKEKLIIPETVATLNVVNAKCAAAGA